MPSHLGPIEVYCDAPPYSIIQACHRIGIQNAEDVRWLRMSHFLNGDGPAEYYGNQPWKHLLGMNKQRKTTCSCGQGLPVLEKCTFTYITGREASYFLGQCKRCRTVYWEDA